MRVLPAQPSAGESAIRVHLGDSLLAERDRDSLFAKDSMRLVTPRGHTILIPEEFVRQDGFNDNMRQLVEAAVAGESVPRAVLSSVAQRHRSELEQCRADLTVAIGDEGNGVWTWYAVNLAAPHLLSERKVDRIVANPPWVKRSTIQEPQRKRVMETLGKDLALQVGGRQSPHLDIAAFFVLRARELYLRNPQRDPAVWLVKKSALRSGHWALSRERLGKELVQSVDLESLQPFGGGDARRCCLLVMNRPLSSEGPTSGARHAETKARVVARRLEAQLRLGPGTQRLPRKPRPQDLWSAVRQEIRFVKAPEPLPQAPSDYGTSAFQQGATILPHVLVLAESVFPVRHGRIRVRTRRSSQRPWSSVSPQEVEIPDRWLRTLYRSPEMLPFIATTRHSKAIVPVDTQGRLDLDSAPDEFGWQKLNEVYRRFRGKGKATPRTLARRLDFYRRLSAQPHSRTGRMQMVLYPKSGDIMRAARSSPGTGFVNDTPYWYVASCEREAGFLTAVLNAPCLRRAFFESRDSGRDFHLHPWRRVPIPRFDSDNQHHAKLADYCGAAEDASSEAVQRCIDEDASATRVKLYNAVVDRLTADRILAAIDRIVVRILPEQAELSPRTSS